MKTRDINIDLANYYYLFLKNLSEETKLKLIAKLNKSLKNAGEKPSTNWEDLFGSLELEQSSEEFINDLKKDRNFREKSMDL